MHVIGFVSKHKEGLNLKNLIINLEMLKIVNTSVSNEVFDSMFLKKVSSVIKLFYLYRERTHVVKENILR